jgi:cytochrome c
MKSGNKTGKAAALALLAAGAWMDVCGPAHAAGDVVAGKAAFAKCASCHQIGPAARAGFGPQLNGIVGRPAAATKDYRYSAAMQNSRIVWTEDKLRAFMKAPGDVVPGTKMRFWGIGNAQDLDNLLAYMKTFP